MFDGRAITPRLFRVLLLAGLVLRAPGLPLRGTTDLNVWKLWSHAASIRVTTMYGVGGSPPEHAVLRWGSRSDTVDYPPVALYALGLVGRAYRAWDPYYDDGPALSAAIKVSILLGDIGLCVAMWALLRRTSESAARLAVVFYWLNPAVVVDGAFLGYLDPWLGALTVAAVLALDRRQYALAGSTLAAALLTKLQVVLVAPMFLLLFARRVDRAQWRRPALAAIGGAGVAAAVIVAPFVRIGAFWNMVQGVGRVFHHDMLSAENVNVWWIATWFLRGWESPVRILGISRAIALGYPNPRIIGAGLSLAVMLWGFWRARRGSVFVALASGAFAMHAYTLLSVQVHENHLYLALPLMAAAGAMLPRLRGPYALTSVVCFLNLLIFQGLGGSVGVPPRAFGPVDLSVLVAFANVGVFAWHARRYAAEAAAGPAEETREAVMHT